MIHEMKKAQIKMNHEKKKHQTKLKLQMKKMIQKMKKAQIKMNHEKKKHQMKLKLQMKKMIQKMKKMIQKYRIYKQIQEIMQMKIPTAKIQLKNLRILLVDLMVDDELQALSLVLKICKKTLLLSHHIMLKHDRLLHERNIQGQLLRK